MLNKIVALRYLLHSHPEHSGEEIHTKTLIIEFLRTHTSLEINPCGDGFYAAHREASASKPSVALRADYDALPTANGMAAHRCGHDGHILPPFAASHSNLRATPSVATFFCCFNPPKKPDRAQKAALPFLSRNKSTRYMALIICRAIHWEKYIPALAHLPVHRWGWSSLSRVHPPMLHILKTGYLQHLLWDNSYVLSLLLQRHHFILA